MAFGGMEEGVTPEQLVQRGMFSCRQTAANWLSRWVRRGVLEYRKNNHHSQEQTPGWIMEHEFDDGKVYLEHRRRYGYKPGRKPGAAGGYWIVGDWTRVHLRIT